jgi:hypothetical protein
MPRAKLNHIRCKAYMYAKMQTDLAKQVEQRGGKVSLQDVGDNNALVAGESSKKWQDNS